MKLTFLGTSAGEFYPAMWCECPYCEYARTHGGRNLRRHSCALLDDDVLIDFPSHAFLTAQALGLNLRKITTLMVTHSHLDHFDPLNLITRIHPSAKGGWYHIPQQFDPDALNHWVGPRFTSLPQLNVICPEPVLHACRHNHIHIGAFGEDADQEQSMPIDAVFQVPKRGETLCCSNQLQVTAVVSYHAEPGTVFNYIIERAGKTLLYACDCGGYDADMLALLQQYRYDLVVFEGTFGLMTEDDPGHMNLQKNRDMLRFFSDRALWKDKPHFVLTHIAPHNTPPYDLYRNTVEAAGMVLAYDGMEIEF